MPTRIVIASSVPAGTFPRWGFLDKYAVNEYMARAFALTVTLVFAVGGALQLLPVKPPVGQPTTAGYQNDTRFDVATIHPPPSLTPRPVLIHSGGGGAKVVPPVIIPVPVRGLDIDVLPSSSGPGTGPPTEGFAEPGEVPAGVPIVEVGAPAWPSPDDILVVEKEPLLITMQPPIYPEIAREAGVEGTVLVRVLVDTQGVVRDRILLQSVLGLDEAALASSATAVFRPALQQDKPVAVWVVVPIEFRLR